MIQLAEKLKIIPLGGLGEIGKNMTVLEYGKDMIIIDCGLGFPEDDMYGVDLVIPDVSYIVKNQAKLRGIFLTHGHEDHIGGLPYALKEFRTTVHSTALTLGLVRLKLEEHGLEKTTKLVTHRAGDKVKAGCFEVEFIHVNHSIADACAFAVKTPVGTLVFSGDFKIDPTDHEGMADLTRFGELGREGVLALLCESTNVGRPGHSPSETIVVEGLDRQFKGCKQRIIVTTFASNMHRLQTLFDTAHRYGRKVAVTGRSMENILKVTTELGYLHIPPNTLVDIAEIKGLPKDKVVIVCTGSQGEDMSAMYRIAFSMHRQVELQPGDRVIISASAIPGNEKAVDRIVNQLYRKGADVVYDKALDLHASGHACQEEIKILHALVKPKFFIPVHGEHKHLYTHARLAQAMGTPAKNTFILDIGQVLELTTRTCKIAGAVPSGRVLVDGMGVGDVGSVVLRDRRHLAEDGMIVVVVNLSADDGSVLTGPDIVTRGFVYVKDNSDLLEELRIIAAHALDQCYVRHVSDWSTIKNTIKNDLSMFLYKKTKRNP
ncbi:MAG: ribonuclease J, partial [Oscillospiraceae bacterium]|nr:ribonuclease J [Oscillospiraceae bacterium]